MTVTFDSTGLAAGTYTANVCVSSDDPDPGPGNGTALVVVPVSLTVEVLNPAISLVKTVGTTPAVCATTTAISRGGRDDGLLLLQVTNTGNVTFATHDLSDDVLGTSFTGLDSTLAPGAASTPPGLSIPHVINTTTTNVGTWTAHNAGPVAAATATASATVTVVVPPNIDVSPLSAASTQAGNTPPPSRP